MTELSCALLNCSRVLSTACSRCTWKTGVSGFLMPNSQFALPWREQLRREQLRREQGNNDASKALSHVGFGLAVVGLLTAPAVCEGVSPAQAKSIIQQELVRLNVGHRKVLDSFEVTSSKTGQLVVSWRSDRGGDAMKMLLALLEAYNKGSSGASLKAEVLLTSPSELRLSIPSRGITVDVYQGSFNEVTFEFVKNGSMSPEDAQGIAKSIASDASSAFRSYTWSSSSNLQDSELPDIQSLFGQHHGGGMLDNFFPSPFGDFFSNEQRDGDRFGKHDSAGRDSRFNATPHGTRGTSDPSRSEAQRQLESMGVQVVLGSSSPTNSDTWQEFAGYDDVKSRIEESVLLALRQPEIFNRIAGKTRGAASASRPKVVLFEGPPGTGKTSTARIISQEAGLPLVYVPLESIVSKFYGESEKQISKVFDLGRKLASDLGKDGFIMFIDEVDAVVGNRDEVGGMHEASKRVLSVILRQIDGFNTATDRTMVICATNRKDDLDKAFISRVDTSIYFPLPADDTRKEIFKVYAKHLADKDLSQLADHSQGLSGRNIKDACQDAERRWAAESHKRRTPIDSLTPPPIEVYLKATSDKRRQQLGKS